MTKLRLLERDQTLCLALSQQRAAEAMGVSLSHFKRHVAPDLRCVYSGRVRIYRVTELERWLEEHEEPTVSDRRAASAETLAPHPAATNSTARLDGSEAGTRRAA